MTENIKQLLMVAFLLVPSFFLRWEYVNNTKIIEPLRADAYAYTMVAKNLAFDHVFTSKPDHHGKPSHDGRPPGYPFFLALIFFLTGSLQAFYYSTLLVQCFIGASTVVLVYILAGFLLPRPWAFLAALLTALSPHMIAMSAYILSESLFTFLLLLAVVLIVWACKKVSAWRFLLAGGVLGLAFVRPTLAIFPLLCAPIIFFFKKDERKSQVWVALALFLFASYSLPASWSIWRTASLGFDTVQASQFKTALVAGFYPGITYKDLPGMPYREDPGFQQKMAKDYPDLARHLVKIIQEDPGRYLGWWLVGKPVMFWSWKVFFSDGINFYPIEYSWFDINPVMKMLRTVMLGIHPVLVILAFIGVVFFCRGQFREPTAMVAYLLCFILVAHFTLMFMALAPFPRYALPLGPELYVMSVFSLWKMTTFVKERRSSLVP